MKRKLVKIIGFAVTAAGLGLALVQQWVDDKELDEKVEEKVNEALAEKEEKS